MKNISSPRFFDAKVIFDKSPKMGFRPNSTTFNVMIKGLLKREAFDEACCLFDEMLERNVEPSVVTYNSFIGFLCKKGEMENAEGALKVLNVMFTSGHCPRLETLCQLVAGLLKCGKIDGACFVLEEMEKRKMSFDLEAWGALVRDACGGDDTNDLQTQLILVASD
ncbi:hypothetical protein QUC31_018568 [Theobroma cacao]